MISSTFGEWNLDKILWKSYFNDNENKYKVP